MNCVPEGSGSGFSGGGGKMGACCARGGRGIFSTFANTNSGWHSSSCSCSACWWAPEGQESPVPFKALAPLALDEDKYASSRRGPASSTATSAGRCCDWQWKSSAMRVQASSSASQVQRSPGTRCRHFCATATICRNMSWASGGGLDPLLLVALWLSVSLRLASSSSLRSRACFRASHLKDGYRISTRGSDIANISPRAPPASISSSSKGACR
mmetsp:Transcript_4413/g.10807  ORF Transcript_4413/g.10807 Transcript_4413/m.10807 type:complete len:213 (+) Transcript_4413:457-1095(+)